MDETTEHHLAEIERHVRAARGEKIESTPWDFTLPTGSDLKYLRERCGYSREAMGKVIGYSPGTIARVETGHAAPGREYLQSALRFYRREWPREIPSGEVLHEP